MLGRPEDGWTLFQLGGEETAYDLSYVTDVAAEWLAQAIHGMETLDVFSVHGFCEPGRVICTVSYWSCYVIFEDDGRAPACRDVTHLHVSMLDFCRKLYRDISENLDAWVDWNADEDGEEALRARKEALTRQLNRLSELIEENKEDFDADHCFI